jgi:Flp pilus assembly protein TadG
MIALLRLLQCWHLASDRRGAVALWMGLTTPVLIAAMGMGIEVSDWSAVKVELQRTADAAALTGVYYYKANSSQSNVKQKAATAAAYVAQINGVSGDSGDSGDTLRWSDSSSTLTDNEVTVTILDSNHCVAGTTCTIGARTTVSRTVSLAIGKIFKSNPAITLSATSIAELIPGQQGDPACMLALQGDINGVTTSTDLGVQGSVTVNAGNCALRSDASVKVSGNVTINTMAIYTAGTYTANGGSATVTATDGIHQNSGQISDPMLGYTALQNALTAVKAIASTVASISCGSSGCSGPPGCCTNTAVHDSNGHVSGYNVTIAPGSYGGFSSTSNSSVSITMSNGLYLFRDNVSISGPTQLTATNVSIVTGGTSDSKFNGNSLLTLTAATTDTAASISTNAPIPGIPYASAGTTTTTFNGTSGTAYTGLVYSPNGSVTVSGNATDGTSGCGEIVANTITLSGSNNTTVAPNCSAYGLNTIYSMPATSHVSLVE